MTTPSTPSATLLIVDDEELNRQMLALRLQRRGYNIALAQNGYQALEIIAQQTPDLVLLDVMMPGLNGMDVLKEVRKTHSMTELPIIMTTALDQSQDVVDALELGANDYVTKPIDFAVVLARIQAHLQMKRLARPEGERTPTPHPTPGAPLPEVGPGALLDSRYRLDELLGSGGSGKVYRATHLNLGHQVAVKILRANAGPTPEQRARFQREGVAACRIRHPNAVAVLDFAVTDEGITYLVMELLEGHTLADELREKGRLTPSRCAEILLPICDVLTDAHAESVIHRDLKPANIFLQGTRYGENVKVVDFGIAKLLNDERDNLDNPLTLVGHVLGTPAYMAPERLLRRAYDGRADVYSLGIMLWQMLAGRLPFMTPDNDPLKIALMQINESPPSLREVNSAISPAVENVVMTALAKNPDARPTADQLAESFARAVRAGASRRISDILRHGTNAGPDSRSGF
jgi:CheY-like chemotaxis protein